MLAKKHMNLYGGGGNGTLTPTETATPTPELTPTGTLTPTPEPTPTLPPKGEEPPTEGWTVEQAKGLVKRDGLKAHLGEQVAYSPAQDKEGVYRIFYYDNEVNSKDSSKGYFGDTLRTLYLKRDFDYTKMNLYNHLNHTPSDGGVTMKNMNPKWAEETNGSSIDLQNEHCVAWLCDPKEWINYKVENVANYVIGSPSVEMYMKAYNVYKDNNPNSTTLINKIGNIDGYYVGTQNSYGNPVYYTEFNSVKEGPNNIFLPVVDGWWLASPSSCNSGHLLYAPARQYYRLMSDDWIEYHGVCPVVSIKSVISYEKK